MGESSADLRVVLLGMMGSGKTTVGRELAERTGWRYADNDELVRLVTGREPDEIDAAEGEDALHVAEGAALRHALAMPPPLIVGAAAWVILDPSSVERLRSQPWVVYLRGQPETLHARIGSGVGRRDDATDLEWLRRRSDERDHLYRELATLTIDVDDLGPAQIVDRIIEAVEAEVRDRR